MRTDPTVNGGRPYYYQQDRNHNVTHLTNTAGAVIEKYKYDAFGAQRLRRRTALNAQRPSTKIVSCSPVESTRQRSGSTNIELAHTILTGRFMSEDPKGFDAGDYNLFRYCHNDPFDRLIRWGWRAACNPSQVITHFQARLSSYRSAVIFRY